MPTYVVQLENRQYGSIEVEADDEEGVEGAVDEFLQHNYDKVQEDSEDGWELSSYDEVEY